MYEALYNTAKQHDADIVDCGIYFESNGMALLTAWDNVTGTLDDEKRRILILSGGYLTTKIIKAELLNEPRVRMRENIKCFVDNDLVKYLTMRARNLYNVKEILYVYCDTAGSATKTLDIDPYCNSLISVMGSIYDMCSTMPGYDRLRDALEYTIINWYSCGVNRCLYNQIKRFGASSESISNYFDNTNAKEQGYLSGLAAQKKRVITIPYSKNSEVVKRISGLDIQIMEECDRRYS